MSNALPQRFRGNMSDSAKQPAAGIASDSVDSVNQTASAFNASTNSASPTSSVSTNTAGSWANTTRSPIAVTSAGAGRRQIFVSARRSKTAASIGALLTLIVITLNSANLIDVYGSPLVWGMAAIPAALIGVLIALAGMAPALKLWWQIVFLALAQFIVGPIIALNETTITHIVPTLQTLSQGFTQTFGSFKYVIAVIPPLGTAHGSLMALWTLNLWTAFLAGIFAISSSNKINLITVFPLALNLAASALLGTDHGTTRPACGILAMLVLVIWLSWRWQSLDWQRLASVIIILVLTVGLAFGATLIVPQHRLTLRDRYNPPLDPHQYTSPLSQMRSYVKYHKKDTLITVSGLPAGTPLRLAVMDRFDGNVWNLSDSSDASSSSDYRKIGSSIPASQDGRKFTATFKLHQGFSEQWLPLAGDASSINLSDTDLYYNTGTHSAIVPNSTLAGATYTESGTITPVPSQQEIAHAHAQQVIQPKAKDIPDSAGKLAPALTGKQSTDGATAATLATALKTKGWFSHGLAGDYPSLPGHGNFRIDSMLGGSAMVGDSEQYASAMAMMARELGLPSRVVLGFVPKDKDGNISKARTKQGKDGVTRTDFTGNDIEAWVEINLKGYGWVAFYPTPKETKIPNKNQDLTPPNPKTLVRQPPVPLVDPLRDKNQARDQSSLDGTDAGDHNGNAMLAKILEIAGKVAVYGSPLWIILIICGLILLIKAIQLAAMSRRGTSRQRIVSGWRAIDMLAEQSGIKTSGTRRDQAMQIGKALQNKQLDTESVTTFQTDTKDGRKQSRRHEKVIVRDNGNTHELTSTTAANSNINQQLQQLCREADWVAFSGKSPENTGKATDDYWKRVKAVRKTILAAQPRLRRLRTKLSLKGMFHMPHPIFNHTQQAATGRDGSDKPSQTENSTKRASILATVGQFIHKPTVRKGRS